MSYRRVHRPLESSHELIINGHVIEFACDMCMCRI